MTVYVPTKEELATLAREHLAPELAELWISLLRPAIRLVRPDDAPGAPVLARLGGRPRLPESAEWPRWQERPVSFVAEVDLAAVAASGLDAGRELPRDGLLLVFSVPDGDERGVVLASEPETHDGARLLRVAAGAPERPAPDGAHEYPRLDLVGLQTWTYPSLNDSPLLALTAPSPEAHDLLLHFTAHQLGGYVHERQRGAGDPYGLRVQWPEHRIGGLPEHCQSAVEAEAHEWSTGSRRGAPPAELAQWSLLLQLAAEEELGMGWGDAGTLYWMTRGTADDDLGELAFTWQC